MLPRETADKIKDYGNDLVDKGGKGWSAFYALADYIDTLVSKEPLPSVNWRDGKPYNYCPECGREEPTDEKAEALGNPTRPLEDMFSDLPATY